MREDERGSWWKAIRACAGGSEADRINRRRFLVWTFVWALSFPGASWLLTRGPGLAAPLAWVVAIVPGVLALVALRAYLRFLRETDELVRRIQLDGLAVGFAAGVIFPIVYTLFERIGAPPLNADYILLLMMTGWAVGQLVGTWRYR